MATLAFTFTVPSNAGAQIRRLAQTLEQVASDMPDQVGSGASTVLTFDNAPSSGFVSVQVSGGPYAGSVIRV